jgi:hypothetical protein
MKKLMVFALLLCAVVAMAQDVDSIATGRTFFRTLSGTTDTIQVSLRDDVLGLDEFGVVLKAAAGIDTVLVDFLAPDKVSWYKVAITDQQTLEDSTTLRIGTVARGFLFPTGFSKVRFIASDLAHSTQIMLWGRRSFATAE